jgi:hypothetical protein
MQQRIASPLFSLFLGKEYVFKMKVENTHPHTRNNPKATCLEEIAKRTLTNRNITKRSL